MKILDFWGQMSHPFFFYYEKFTNLFVVALIGLGILRAQSFSYRPQRMLPLAQITITCLLLYAAISLSWSPAFGKGVEQWSYNLPYMLLNLFLVPLVFRHADDLQDGLCALLLIGTVLATLIDVFGNWDNRVIETFWNPSETIWDPLAFSQMAGYITLAAILLNIDKNWKWTAIRSIAIVASIILAVKSETRGQFFMMILIPLVFLPFSRPTNNLKGYIAWAFLGISLVTVSIYAFDSFTEVEGRWSSSKIQSEGSNRLHSASLLLHYWWKTSSGDPAVLIFGLGNSASFSKNIVGYYPHMVSLEILGEEGILGLGILLLLLWVSFRTIRTAYRLSKHDTVQRGIWTTLVASFTFGFLLSFKQGSLVTSGARIFLFIILIERQIAFLTADIQNHDAVRPTDNNT